MGGFINCDEKEVVFTAGATNGLNIIAYSYGLANLKAGDEILITLAEHASNVLPWFDVAKKTGAVIRYIDLDEEGRLTPAALKKAMSDNVRIVAFAAVTNVMGYIADVKELCRIYIRTSKTGTATSWHSHHIKCAVLQVLVFSMVRKLCWMPWNPLLMEVVPMHVLKKTAL